MIFKDVAIGKEFMSAGARYRKCSEKKAHLLDDPRDGAGPLRFREEQEVEQPPAGVTNKQLEVKPHAKPEVKKAEQVKP